MSRHRPKSRATLTAEPVAGLDGATRYTVDCRHGTTTAIVMTEPGGDPPHPPGWITLAIVNLTLEEGCDCCAALWARYAPIFAESVGIPCPPFRSIRTGGAAAWFAARQVRT